MTVGTMINPTVTANCLMKSIANTLDFREIGVFNSREIALFICVVFLLLYCFSSKGVRHSLLGVFKAMFAKQLTIVYILAILYSSVPIFFFYKLGFWRTELIKDVSFWLLFSAFPTLFSINKANKTYFINTLKDNLKFSVITDFITSQHTFNIFVEIIIVVSSVFIGGMIAFSGRDEKYKDVNNIFKILSYIVGGYIFISSIYYFIGNISNFTNINKFEEFSLPIILGIWFIPFLYAVYLYMIYESVFLSMRFGIDNEEIRNFAKKKVLIHFNFNISSLERWRSNLLLNQVKTKEEVLISFLDLKKQELIERNPPKVDILQGWSPYESKDFLSNKGIDTNHYKKCYDDEWQAISPYIKLNNEIVDNNVAYYVTGGSNIANQLKLVLNVNSRIEEDVAINRFLDYVNSLYEAALNKTLPDSIVQSISKRKDKTLKVLNKEISVRRVDHISKVKGYTLSFTIKQE